MATKTISIDLEAYDRLVRARLSPKESFSSVIKRSEFKPPQCRAGAFLAAIQVLPPVDEDTLKRWDNIPDPVLDDPWQD